MNKQEQAKADFIADDERAKEIISSRWKVQNHSGQKVTETSILANGNYFLMGINWDIAEHIVDLHNEHLEMTT